VDKWLRGLGQALVVPAETTAFDEPGKGSLHDPPARKDDECVRFISLHNLDHNPGNRTIPDVDKLRTRYAWSAREDWERSRAVDRVPRS
jgi:hypothetical protein